MKDISLGVDIEEVDRFKALVRNKRFLNRVFTKAEIAYCGSKKNKAQHFAVRFAAKEAIWKALSEVIRKNGRGVAHRDVGIKNDPYGRPKAVLPESLRAYRNRVSVTLSHTRSYAVAVAVVRTS